MLFLKDKKTGRESESNIQFQNNVGTDNESTMQVSKSPSYSLVLENTDNELKHKNDYCTPTSSKTKKKMKFVTTLT